MLSKHDNLATVLTSEDVYNSLKGIMEIAELILDSLNSTLRFMMRSVKNYLHKESTARLWERLISLSNPNWMQSHYIKYLQMIWLTVNWDSSPLKWLLPELSGSDCAKVCQHTCYLGWLDVVLLLECRPCFVWVCIVVNVCGKWAPILVSWNYAELLLEATHFVVWVLYLGCHWTFLVCNHLIYV